MTLEMDVLHQKRAEKDQQRMERGKIGERRKRRKGRKRKIRFTATAHAILIDFLSSTTFHGAAHLVAQGRHPLERVTWCVLVVLAAMAAYFVSMDTWYKYSLSPTVISVERDRWTWNTSFPAATVCPERAMPGTKLAESEERALEDIARGLVNSDEDYKRKKELLVGFLKALSTATLGNFNSLRPYLHEGNNLPSPNMFKELFLKAQPNFTFESSSSALRVPRPVPVLNELGLCHSIFSVVGGTGKGSRRRRIRPESLLSGNPLDGDTNAQLVQMSHGYKVYFHSPLETADVSAKALFVPLVHYANVELTAVSTITTDEARDGLSVEQRKCRFEDESLETNEMYSYNICRTRCRAKYALSLCGCVPHLFGEYEGAVTCNVEGLLCLVEHEGFLIKLQNTITGKKAECSCLPMCNDVNYLIQHSRVIIWPLGGSLMWGLTEYPNTRYKRDVLFGFADLLGSFGGTAGFFLGCSLLTGVEIVYFFTIRVFWTFYNQIRKIKPENRERKAQK